MTAGTKRMQFGARKMMEFREDPKTCVHPIDSLFQIPMDTVAILEVAGMPTRPDGYVGSLASTWCRRCGKTLNDSELERAKSQIRRRRTINRTAIGSVIATFVLGLGWWFGQALEAGQYDSGGWLGNWLMGVLVVLICTCLAALPATMSRN